MAAIPVALDVVVYPKGRAGGDQPYPAFVTGVAWRTDVGVGGGPVFPPPGGGGGGEHPDHTLPGDLPHPEHPGPIVPPPSEKPPETEDWQWIWTVRGWALLPPGGGGKPQPVPPG